MGGGKTEIGGGRPGTTYVVATSDGRWMLTFEYWGGGANTRYVIADDPLKFFRGSQTGMSVGSLPVVASSRPLAGGGSLVLVRLPDGRLVYNAAGSGDVWVDESGRSDGVWTGNATVGRRIGQWVDNRATGSWNLVRTSDGSYRFQSVKNTCLYLTGASAGAPLTLQNAATDGSQD